MVSVIVPVYNAEKYLRRCIDSILSQTYKNFELIIVNDGSTDNSLRILKEYANSDSRIKLINQENKGVAGARNTGISLVKGKYFLYVDADDWISEDMIECLVSLAEPENADIVMCASDQASERRDIADKDKINIEIWNQNDQRYEFLEHKRMTGMLWNKLIKYSIAEKIQFNEKTGYGEDAEFLWKLLKNSQKMIVTNKILYHHVMEESSISHLEFSSKKYSAIPMWEGIVEDVYRDYPELSALVIERLMSAAVFSMYEARKSRYKNKDQIKHMRQIVRANLGAFLRSCNVSKKFKIYAIAVFLGI